MYFTVSEKNIGKKKFFLISCLLMGAAQQKLSFILTGGLVGLWAFWKAFRNTKLVLAIGIICFVFFFLPRGIWNLEQKFNLGLTSFFNPLPIEFLDSLHFFRENNWWFPFNLFIPDSLGNVTRILGFQILLLFFVRTKNKKFLEVIALSATGIMATYLFGQSIAKSCYEFVLWTAVAFFFLPVEEFRFRLYNRFLLVQGLIVFGGAAYGILTLFPGVFSQEMRQKVMHRNADHYSAIAWVNQALPEDAVVISGPSSVSLFSHDFLPTDWIPHIELNNKYYDAIKLKKPNFLVAIGKSLKGHHLAGCTGGKFLGPKTFMTATRNPFNSGVKYYLTVYHFNSSLLPECDNKNIL